MSMGMTIANLLGLIWLLFGAYVGWFALTNRAARNTKFTINLMIAMIYLIFGTMALLFGQKMSNDQQWIFVAFTFSLIYMTREFLRISRSS
jgi:H+/Cl- antiporter ClcA